MATSASGSLLVRHEFLLRRLHSLSGLVPVGAYMVVHLITNSLTMMGVEPFQNAVYQIHALGPALPIVEWGFIFGPILFHAIFGVVIIMGGRSNVSHYGYAANWRYVMQRITGMIALLFIFAHVFHLHGWFHFDLWLEKVAKPLGGARFSPYNASSTLAAAMQSSFVVPLFYAIGVLSCVFHLANGIWTMGITWGVWVNPPAQRRAGFACLGLGVALAGVSMISLAGPLTIDADEAMKRENEMYEMRVEEGSVMPNEHKRAGH
ncbi:MAG TPA: succinate dehydrogenase [Planctomycetaceae bacterium]|nr:succinate dehydrogenase [Planctomycetaceae bacterium]HRF01725.1 succinate dehydrogenase cytochrome b558 subunit [Pirellulaceae bacterium]